MGAGDSAAQAADLLLEVYLAYRDQFDLVTRRAAARFEGQDWSGGQRDAHERLVLYSQFVRWVRRDVESLLGDRATDQDTWAAVKQCYAGLTLGRPDSEIARTFFNSISRRLCATVGVNPRIEFLDEEYHSDATAGELELLRYDHAGDTGAVIGRLLADLPLHSRYEDEGRDVRLAAAALDREVASRGAGPMVSVEVLPAVFYRNKAAYVVGRAVTGESVLPLALAFVQRPGGMIIDAVLTSKNEVGVVFGFTRSYFHVDAPQPAGVVRFLGSILGAKRRHELYTAIGFNRHGKSELYRTLRAALKGGQCHLEPAEGEPGLVMTVFRLAGLQVVFKVIRDHFGAPKRTTRRAVREKYQLVFVRDRVGRLADAQEFEHLEFRTSWFAPELLAELQREASRSVKVEGDRVIIRHLYTEREVEPLNVYLRRVPLSEAKRSSWDTAMPSATWPRPISSPVTCCSRTSVSPGTAV